MVLSVLADRAGMDLPGMPAGGWDDPVWDRLALHPSATVVCVTGAGCAYQRDGRRLARVELFAVGGFRGAGLPVCACVSDRAGIGSLLVLEMCAAGPVLSSVLSSVPEASAGWQVAEVALEAATRLRSFPVGRLDGVPGWLCGWFERVRDRVWELAVRFRVDHHEELVRRATAASFPLPAGPVEVGWSAMLVARLGWSDPLRFANMEATFGQLHTLVRGSGDGRGVPARLSFGGFWTGVSAGLVPVVAVPGSLVRAFTTRHLVEDLGGLFEGELTALVAGRVPEVVEVAARLVGVDGPLDVARAALS